MIKSTVWRTLVLPLGLLSAAGPAAAAPLTFDCDARPNASASIANLAQTYPSISGTITARQFREGEFLPIVGANITTVDGSALVGFQLRSPAADASQYDILLNSNVAGQREDLKVGTVASNQPITFRITLDEEGVVRLYINNQFWSAPFQPLTSGKETAYCSTGQFEFSNLRFSD